MKLSSSVYTDTQLGAPTWWCLRSTFKWSSNSSGKSGHLGTYNSVLHSFLSPLCLSRTAYFKLKVLGCCVRWLQSPLVMGLVVSIYVCMYVRYLGRLNCDGSEVTVEECRLMFVEVANCSEQETTVECTECEHIQAFIHTKCCVCLCMIQAPGT